LRGREDYVAHDALVVYVHCPSTISATMILQHMEEQGVRIVLTDSNKHFHKP
jgi:hypothetical protein